MTSATEAVIETHGLAFGYGRRTLLSDVELAVPERDFVCLVGPNGSGKTTLLKLLLGLLQPTRGAARIFGEAPAAARSRIGYVPQHPQLDPLFPISVTEVALMGRLGGGSFFGPVRGRDRELAQTALADVGLGDLGDRHFASLSVGQQQRALIARALACAPQLLLLDEPTASLDARVEEEFYELLQRLNESLTIVLVSHDLGFVSRYVKTVVCVKGRVMVHPTSEVNGQIISELYGSDVRMVRHDHRCNHEGEHLWPPS